MAQVDEVGQSGLAVGDDGVRDLHHRQEGDGALLHTGASRGGSGKQRQPFESRPFDGVDESFGRGHADRAGEEAELAGDHGHTTAGDGAFAGDDGFVDAGFLRCSFELSGVGVRDPAGRLDGSGVPGQERSFVEDDVDEFVCVQTRHDGPVQFPSASHATMESASSSSSGGAS